MRARSPSTQVDSSPLAHTPRTIAAFEDEDLTGEQHELLSCEDEERLERVVRHRRGSDWPAAAYNAVICTYLAEVMFYVVRKAPSLCKIGWQQDLHLTMPELGALDTAFLGCYTVSQFVSGFLGERLGARMLISGALLGASLCSFFTSRATSFSALLFISTVHGAFQAMGYPASIQLLSEHVTSERKASIMGVWGTNCAVGGVIGMWLGAWLISHYSWTMVFLVPAPLIFATAVLSFLLLEDRSKSDRWSAANHHHDIDRERALGFCETLMLPDVLLVGFAYFFLKFGRYCLMFWLPYYHNKALGFDVGIAGFMASGYEVGSIFGSVLHGFLCDRHFNGRATILTVLMIACAGLLLVLYTLLPVHTEAGAPAVGAAGFPSTLVILRLALNALIGLFVSGGDYALTTVVVQEIAMRTSRGLSAVGALAGVIYGLGSLGSVVQGVATPALSEAFGWSAVFHALTACCAASCALLARPFAREWQWQQAQARVPPVLSCFSGGSSGGSKFVLATRASSKVQQLHST